ncbi:MAG: hypothetical protein A3J28_05845 [Acidobacteria bacterium RIFCSPLOWO2_12_FULL_60_22]|nr:MAG: hypothetical protein A3J28_05845 [Acidobacteria bacterium RIFCSPLOWO2_12_FULL_60_22]
MGAGAAACALMALEKWLYDEIERSRSITPWVQFIFEEAESLAFAGVLVSIGLKHPALFARDLQPLLGNFHIYRCQLNWAQYERGEPWRIELSTWANHGERIVKLAVDWHSMAHRRYLLQDVAPWLMLQDKGTLKYLSERRAEWAKQFDNLDENDDHLELFLARFDPQNYIKTPQSDRTVLIEMRLPPHLEVKIKQAQEENELHLLSLTFASGARQYLSGEKTLVLDSLPEFAAQIRRLASRQTSDISQSQEQYRINSIAGGDCRSHRATSHLAFAKP